MLITLLIFGIFNQIQNANSACTVNFEYSRSVTSVYEITLCTDSTCATPKSTLKNGETYTHCIYGQESPINSLKIQIAKGMAQSNVQLTRCLTDTGWKDKDKNYACPSYSSLTFSTYSQIGDSETYVVYCSGKEVEFPNEDVPKLQISGYDSIDPALAQKSLLVYPTQAIYCISNCKEVIPSWSVSTGNNLVEVVNNILIPKIVTPSVQGVGTQVTSVCSHSSSISKHLKFYVADKIQSRMVSYTADKPRRPDNTYDAGESLSCSVTGKNSVVNTTINRPPNANIGIVYLDSSNNIVGPPLNKIIREVIIPDNLQLDKNGVGIICYFGNYSVQTTNLFLIINKFPIKIGSRFVTKLKIVKSDKILESYDFVANDRIQCNRTYYEQLIITFIQTLEINILYGNPIAYPYSIFTNFNDSKFDTSQNNDMTFQKKYSNRRMFAYCKVTSFFTTPVQIFSGDRPTLVFKSTHPNWNTEYHLRGFQFVCNGTNIEDIALTCLNCLPDTSMIIKKLDMRTITLEIPNIKTYTEISYVCTGISSKYDSVKKTLNLKIIVNEMSIVEIPLYFNYYGEDYLRCISSFTVIKDKKPLKETIIIPVFMKINGEPIINSKGEKMELLFNYKNEKPDVTNKVIQFSGCCPFHSADGYHCISPWKIVNVAKNYRVEFSANITILYPGNLLKCHICVNYTHDSTPALCMGENKIQSKIKMRVKSPVGYVNETDLLDEIRMPLEELKPDQKTYFDINDYEVYIGCLIRQEVQMIRISLLSCQTRPPAIYISPTDKTMFVVGEIFSCTTDSINCKTGISYKIYIFRGQTEIDSKISNSLTLQPKHVGNNIKIKCIVEASSPPVSSERIVRVEMKPTNVTIDLVQNIMVYRKYLKCVALGFPQPSISWNQVKGPSVLVQSETFILIGPWDFAGDYNMQCEARNERGSTTVSASFKIFNPRIFVTDYSATFYLFLPVFTLIYLVLLILSILIIFQESVFGVPFFSGGKAGYKKKMLPRPVQASEPISHDSMTSH